MGKFSATRSSGRSTSAHNRPLSVIPRNSVTIDMSPLGKYHPGTNEGEVLAGQGSARLTRIGVYLCFNLEYSRLLYLFVMRFILFSIVVHCIISTVAWLYLK